MKVALFNYKVDMFKYYILNDLDIILSGFYGLIVIIFNRIWCKTIDVTRSKSNAENKMFNRVPAYTKTASLRHLGVVNKIQRIFIR